MQGLAYTNLYPGRVAEGSPGAGRSCRDVTAAPPAG
jgi:hypothetical protein